MIASCRQSLNKCNGERLESDRNSTRIARLKSLLAASHAEGTPSEKIWDW